MAKNIVIFSDGTGQKGGIGSNTNVYKLFNIVEDRTREQIAFYDPGLGTDWRKITGSISGKGISKNILECYRFIFENFESGDKIFLFGFSRGAATVRSLSEYIHLFGMMPKSRSDLIEKAFKIYKIRDDTKRAKTAENFIKKHHTIWTNIEFLGVWDTVAALGFPIKWVSTALDNLFPHTFHSFELSKAVKHARQALSLDDERKTFHPKLWNKIKDDNKKQSMKQVWFCGVHTDVGGGYDDDDLSIITLKWMIQEAISKGLRLYPYSDKYIKLMGTNPDINGKMHNEQEGFFGKIYRKKQRIWDKAKHGEPCVHESVFQRTKNTDNLDTPAYKQWILKYMDKHEQKQCIVPWVK